jgi:hypothetical protein
MTPYVAYVETSAGIWREEDGRMTGPFSREALGLSLEYIPECQTIRCGSFPEGGASLSFGFGYGPRADNSFSGSNAR